MEPRRRIMLLLAVAVFTLGWAHGIDAQHTPAGDFVWALHVSIAPAWFDPGENGGLIRVGYRVAEHTINSIPLHPGPAFQNIRLK